VKGDRREGRRYGGVKPLEREYEWICVSKGGPSGGAACEGAKRGSMWVSERSEGEGAQRVGEDRRAEQGRE